MTVSEWAHDFRKVNQPGAYIGPYRNETTPYMEEPADELTSAELRGLVFVGSAQTGKALALYTPLPTPDGWTTMGDVLPGDELLDDNGFPVEVLAVSGIMHGHKVYRITFDDGSHLDADAEHLWTLRDIREDKTKTINTDEIADTFRWRGRNRYAIGNTKPLSVSGVSLPVDPYVLGAWLGDGHGYSAWVYAGQEDAEHFRTQLGCCGYSFEESVDKGVVVLKPLGGRDGQHLRSELRRMNLLGNKHIPADYLRAPQKDLWALLAGLMDTDGTIDKRGRCSFSTCSTALRDGVLELLCALGFKPLVRERVTFCTYKNERRESLSWEISFAAYDDEPVFRLHRKIDRLNSREGRRPSHARSRFIVAADEIPSVPVKCVFVNNASHLFLAGERMIPTHNTDALVVNWTGYGAHVDGQDMMIVCQSFTAARDFSMRRVDRLIRYTPEVKKALAKGSNADNKFDKTFDNGMLLTISHPSKNELSGKPVGRIAITDYDRIDDDVDGEGNAFDLSMKRTTTFQSNGMCLAESSPSREITDHKKVVTGHMAPPTTGILALYNRGDRRRWHWPCPHCGSYFEGKWEYMKWDHDQNGNTEKALTCFMECPNCFEEIKPRLRYKMNLWGQWVKEGQHIDEEGYVRGTGNGSNIASFWLMGVAASFVSWPELVKMYLDAEDDYAATGDEGALRKFFNTDLGLPYIPKHIIDSELRTPEALQGRCEEWTHKKVPAKVRFLLGLVDVQKNAFVVQIIGIAPGAPFDMYLIDRFTIHYSDRLDPNAPPGQESYLWVKPHAHLEDWNKIEELVINAAYELDDDSGRKMTVKLTLCDSGGKAGVTAMAYNYYRKIRREGKMHRFHLVKGDSKPGAPRSRITYPDSGKGQSKAGARGEIPVLMLNPTINKDNLDGRLDVLEEGKGMIHLPEWLIDENMTWFFAELTSEARTPGKGWEKVAKRNEAWDLFYYAIGACVSSLIGVERLNWDKPPSFAAEWDDNPLVIEPEAISAFTKAATKKIDFAAFGKAIG